MKSSIKETKIKTMRYGWNIISLIRHEEQVKKPDVIHGKANIGAVQKVINSIIPDLIRNPVMFNS